MIGTVGTVELVENLFTLLRGQPGALVRDGDDEAVVPLKTVDTNAGADRGVFDSVAEEVFDDLGKAIRIGQQGRGLGRQVQFEAVAAPLRRVTVQDVT